MLEIAKKHPLLSAVTTILVAICATAWNFFLSLEETTKLQAIDGGWAKTQAFLGSTIEVNRLIWFSLLAWTALCFVIGVLRWRTKKTAAEIHPNSPSPPSATTTISDTNSFSSEETSIEDPDKVLILTQLIDTGRMAVNDLAHSVGLPVAVTEMHLHELSQGALRMVEHTNTSTVRGNVWTITPKGTRFIYELDKKKPREPNANVNEVARRILQVLASTDMYIPPHKLAERLGITTVKLGYHTGEMKQKGWLIQVHDNSGGRYELTEAGKKLAGELGYFN